MIVLIILRHGRTEANAQGLLLGRADPVLDDVGRGQAGPRPVRWPRPPRCRIVPSPLARRRATAEVMAGVLGADAPIERIDERWIELDYGELDGTPLCATCRRDLGGWRGDVDCGAAGRRVARHAGQAGAGRAATSWPHRPATATSGGEPRLADQGRGGLGPGRRRRRRLAHVPVTGLDHPHRATRHPSLAPVLQRDRPPALTAV